MEMSTSTAPGFMVFTMARVTSFGAAAPATRTAPMTRSASRTSRSMVAVVEYAVRSAGPNIDESSRSRAIDHRDVGAQSHGHLRRVGAGDSTAENDHFRRRHAGHSAKQHAEAPVGL